MSEEFKPWKGDKIQDKLPKHKTIDTSEGMQALKGVREKMGEVLKKDQALKVSMYVPKKISRKEGEVWDEDGKQWTIKNGIRMSISNLQDAKMPWWCPKCDKTMNNKLDRKFFYKKGKCHDCVVADETEMRFNGTWHAYECKAMYANAVANAKDMLDQFKSMKEEVSNPQIHFQDGRFEEWNIGVDKIKEDLQIEIDQLEVHLVELQNEASKDVGKFQQVS